MKFYRSRAIVYIFPLLIWTCAGVGPKDHAGPHAEQLEQYGHLQPVQEIQKVYTGLDVLKQIGFEPLLGLNVGVITNHTALSKEGEHLVDLLYATETINLKAIFAPEHGFRGDAQAGDAIPGGIDPKTQAPIYSLYGANREPNQEMLEGLDILIFDIQDVGARFYTYISTMGYVLEAGAKHDLPIMILDRPNPIGRAIGGNVLDPGFESFVGRYEIPIRYGLTVGELARMIIGERMISGLDSLELHVVECEGWSSDRVWNQTDLTWIPPSPNMRNINEALTYPGLCLLEGVKISEGRGTVQPFELIGTPYMNGALVSKKLIQTGLEGFSVEPNTYTPVDMPGVSMNPIYKDEEVNGVKVTVTDASLFKPVEFLIHFLVIVRDQYPDKFGWRSSRGPDRLWGGTYLREMIDAGNTASEIIQVYQQELEQFDKTRQQYFIYE